MRQSGGRAERVCRSRSGRANDGVAAGDASLPGRKPARSTASRPTWGVAPTPWLSGANPQPCQHLYLGLQELIEVSLHQVQVFQSDG